MHRSPTKTPVTGTATGSRTPLPGSRTGAGWQRAMIVAPTSSSRFEPIPQLPFFADDPDLGSRVTGRMANRETGISCQGGWRSASDCRLDFRWQALQGSWNQAFPAGPDFRGALSRMRSL